MYNLNWTQYTKKNLFHYTVFIDLSIQWNIYIIYVTSIVHFSFVLGTQNKGLIFSVFPLIVSRYFRECFLHFMFCVLK